MTIFPRQQIYPCGTPILWNTSIEFPCYNMTEGLILRGSVQNGQVFFCILSFQALSCHHSLVASEVTLSVQRLVKKYGHELHVVAWDAVLDITEALQQQIEV